MRDPNLPFERRFNEILQDLAKGHCVAITGLSNTGKSTLMRGLAREPAREIFEKEAGQDGILIYIDCNRAVALSAQAFYEVVLRSALDRLTGYADTDLINSLQSYYVSVTETDSAFSASLSFNLALTDTCENLDRALCLLLDEFDEIYSVLDDRALLNMRALRDRFKGRLMFVTATVRSLPELRGRHVESEFSEMFTRSSYQMPPLTEEQQSALIDSVQSGELSQQDQERCRILGGGHPGLVLAVTQVLSGGSIVDQDDLAHAVGQQPQPRSECLKIWTQLTEGEQAALASLTLEAEASLPEPQIDQLMRLGLVLNKQVFSPVFADFVARRSRGAEVKVKGVFMDLDSGEVWVDGIRIPVLTDLEFKLLKLLYERVDKLTDKYRIVSEVWGEDYLGEVDDARVEKLVSRLRSKIEQEPSNPIYLVTQRGRGYKLFSKPRAS